MKTTLIAAVASSCFGLLCGCEDSSTADAGAQQPKAARASAQTPAPSGSGPQIAFAKLTHDFGPVNDTEKYTATFPFTNTGDQTLIIRDIKTSCGCTAPTLNRMSFAPGESDEITVTFDPKGKTDEQLRYITVISNAQPEPHVKLAIEAVVAPLVRIEPKFLAFGRLERGEVHKRDITLQHHDPDLSVSNFVLNNPALSAELVESSSPVQGSDRYLSRIEVTINPGVDWGSLYATNLKFLAKGRLPGSDAPITKDYTVFITADIFGDLQCTNDAGRAGSMISAGVLKPNQRFQKHAMLTRLSGFPFRVLDATITETDLPGVSVEVETVNPSTHRIVLKGTASAYQSSFRGAIRVRTDVQGEEECVIRFAGTVRP